MPDKISLVKRLRGLWMLLALVCAFLLASPAQATPGPPGPNLSLACYTAVHFPVLFEVLGWTRPDDCFGSA